MSMLRSRFEIDESEGRPIEFLLGMAIEQNLKAGTVRMNMEMAIVKFTPGILAPEELVKSADINFPMLPNSTFLRLKEREVPVESFDYFSVVGSLIHFTNCMRPGLAFAVTALSRHSLAPGKAHVRAARRVVMYLHNARPLGIAYRLPDELKNRNVPVYHEGAKHPLDSGLNRSQVLADSDYAGDETRK